MTDAKELSDFFFEAALASYAGDGPKIPEEEISPGFKGYRFKRGSYVYVDKYAVFGTGSFGQSVIWCDSQPIWFMQYNGFCHEKRAIALVKKAMREAYSKRLFLGGRGIKRLREADLAYGNSGSEDIVRFNGSDWVVGCVDGREAMIFWHDYRGGFVAKPKCMKRLSLETHARDLPCECSTGDKAESDGAEFEG